MEFSKSRKANLKFSHKFKTDGLFGFKILKCRFVSTKRGTEFLT
ncbi:hypothetical protein [uncultured Campylobacter sp.]|nr:hypothetical protein [uncultured Campylobacter sp.]